MAYLVNTNIRLLAPVTADILGAVGPILIIGGFFIIIRSLRLSAVDANYLLSTDERPPLIYLRAFDDDVHDRRQLNILALISPAAAVHSWEAHVAGLLGHFGPFVAIGRPGEPLPELGASRMYVSDDEWKSKVYDLLKQCKLAVLRGGRTEGLRWELGEIVTLLKPHQILLVMPNKSAQRKEFRVWANDVLPKPIPENANAPFMMFDDSWTPIPLPRQRGLGIFFRGFLSPFRAGITLTETLAPFLQQLDRNTWDSFADAEGNRVRRRRNIVLGVLTTVIGLVVAFLLWIGAEIESTKEKQERLHEHQEQQRLRLEKLQHGRSR